MRRLRLSGLTTLRERRLRGDMIETFKTMRGVNHVEREDWFSIQADDEHRPTRTNTLIVGGEVVRKWDIMVREQAALEVWKIFFQCEWRRLGICYQKRSRRRRPLMLSRTITERCR